MIVVNSLTHAFTLYSAKVEGGFFIRLPYRPMAQGELDAYIFFAIFVIVALIALFVKASFEKPPVIHKPEKAIRSIPVTPISSTNNPVVVKQISDDERFNLFFTSVDKSLHNTILGLSIIKVEENYKSASTTTNWKEHFHRLLKDRQFADSRFYDTKYLSFNHKGWDIIVHFCDGKAIFCAVTGRTHWFKETLNKPVKSREWVDVASNIQWSFGMNESIVLLYAKTVY